MPEVAIVGEAWGAEEEKVGRPFVGTSGWLLDQLLGSVGLDRREALVTNVFNFRPARNEVESLCGNKAAGFGPPLKKGKYVLRQYRPEVDRLYSEISAANPNIIIALGATAAWALLGSAGIRNVRGSLALTPLGLLDRQYKVLPTYHPAAVLRQWNLRPIVTADLEKAKRHSGTAKFTRPSRSIWIQPNLTDLDTFDKQYIQPATSLAVDIETKQDQVTCVGFAPSDRLAIVVPFFSQPGISYWRTRDEELVAWDFVRRWCTKASIFQNGLYDMNFLWARHGIAVTNATEDTMLLHHAMQPELEKGLGFLASIYTDEPSWKHMRKGMGHD